MKPEHLELAHRLGAYEFDDPAAALTFSERLARDHGWTARFTQRAVEEYKRFVFLAVAAGHPVSPSHIVDLVWHEHLIHTERYWMEFCGEVLGKPLHHHPTRGGAAETAKFAEWYANTLASYRVFFGEPALEDIWPRPERRRMADEQHLTVNPQQHWIVPKTQFKLCLTAAIAVGAILWWSLPVVSPLDYYGPHFLWFYLASVLMGLIAGPLFRHQLREVDSEPVGATEELDPYAVAYLADGEAGAVNAALTSLVQRGVVSVTGVAAQVRAISSLAADAHPLDRAIHEQASADKGVSVLELRSDLAAPLRRIRTELEMRGWLLSEGQAKRAYWLPLGVAAVVFALGMAKLVMGLSLHRPVEILAVMVAVALFLLVACLARRPRRSLAGDRVLSEMKEAHRGLKTPGSNQLVRQPSLAALAVGLFGVGVLASTALAELQKPLTPKREKEDGGCGGGCGGGCSGGCGGGCGGCGGCGG